MRSDVREIVAAFGGYRKVAERLGKRPTTVHSHMQSGVMPAAWYDAFCRMADIDGIAQPRRDLFSFLKVREHEEDA